MGGMDAGGERKSHAKSGKKTHKKKRLGVRVDMTPMVDVAFLLLTFFMLTTVFAKPQTMELNLPPDDKTNVEVAESSLLTLRLMPDRSVYWNMGFDKPKKMSFNELRPLLVERLRSNSKLITLLKIDRDATYKELVDLMDELNLANITRFSLAPFDATDRALVAKANS